MFSRELLPEPTDFERKSKLLFEIWTALDDGDAGAATREALDRLRDEGTTALAMRPPDICLAESLTAKAMLMIAGQGRF